MSLQGDSVPNSTIKQDFFVVESIPGPWYWALRVSGLGFRV